MSNIIVTFIALFLGWYLRELRETLKKIQNRLEGLKKPQEKEKSKTSFAEPMSPVEFAAMQERERIAKLNE